jgi:hypothetical protein
MVGLTLNLAEQLERHAIAAHRHGLLQGRLRDLEVAASQMQLAQPALHARVLRTSFAHPIDQLD